MHYYALLVTFIFHYHFLTCYAPFAARDMRHASVQMRRARSEYISDVRAQAITIAAATILPRDMQLLRCVMMRCFRAILFMFRASAFAPDAMPRAQKKRRFLCRA